MTAADICAPLRDGSWSNGGVGAFRVHFADPGGEVAHFVAWALEYVAPLNEWVNLLAGNTGQVSAFATTWSGVASSLDGYEEALRVSAAEVGVIEGRMGRALRKRHDEIRAIAAEASDWCSATAASLALASEIVDAVHDAAVGALSQLAGLVTTLFGFTLNPFDKIDQLRQLANRSLDLIEAVAHLIDQMFDALGRLVDLLRSLLPLIQDGLQWLRETLGQLLREVSPAVGYLVGGPVGGVLSGLLGGAASDLLAGDPRVTELNPLDLTESQLQAWNTANDQTTIDSLSDLIRANGRVDLMGQDDRGVVDIMKVVDANGEVHWVVALPSTQDWGLLKGVMDEKLWNDTLAEYPPTNDLDSNIALMLMDNPWMATQYERAVNQAMADAGVPEGAKVVYSGFSQGGIMAATLATNENSPYNTIGVVTNGSPVSGFDFPAGVQVVRFEHEGDVVPQLTIDIDPRDAGTGDWNHTTPADPSLVTLPAPDYDREHGDEPHNNENYVDSIAAWEAGQPTSGEPPFYAGTIVEHQQHTWSE